MATQVIELELTTAPPGIPLRTDVRNVFLVVTDHGVPVSIARIPRPASGILVRDTVTAIVSGRSGPVVSPILRSAVQPHPAITPLSIVVCTHERPDDLSRCLDSLANAIRDGHEVIVVDNAPETGRTAEIATRAGIRLIQEPRKGLNRARNAGLTAATHSIVAFVDDDVVVSRGWSIAIGGAFADARVGCVTGLVLPLELETDGQEQFELYSAHRRDLTSHFFSRDTIRPSSAGVAGMGANMAFRRDLLRKVGGCDERLDAGTRTRSGGDNDMFARVLDAGAGIVYLPDAFVWHRHRRSIQEVRSCVFGYGAGVFAMLTKRLVERRDARAAVTAARWLAGPIVKRARAGLRGYPAPRWDVVLAETAGALMGPFLFAQEAVFSRPHP